VQLVLVRAAAHPLVDVVGHPTGRLLLSRSPADFDVLALLDACAAHGTAVELNANPARLDFGERWLREAKARGVLVSIAADAHAAEELGNLEHGIAVARRAGLGPDDVLNTWSIDALRTWLQARRTKFRGAA
jgi:DNA polymerase (family 10)